MEKETAVKYKMVYCWHQYCCTHSVLNLFHLWLSVLVLFRLEFIFFVVAPMTVFWICTVNNWVYSTGMLSSLLSCIELFCSLHHPTSKEAGGAEDFGKGPSQDNSPQITKRIYHTWHHAHHIKLGKKKEGGGHVQTDSICPPK